jgi:hypothetical protein
MSYRILHAQNKETPTLWGPLLGSHITAFSGNQACGGWGGGVALAFTREDFLSL